MGRAGQTQHCEPLTAAPETNCLHSQVPVWWWASLWGMLGVSFNSLTVTLLPLFWLGALRLPRRSACAVFAVVLLINVIMQVLVPIAQIGGLQLSRTVLLGVSFSAQILPAVAAGCLIRRQLAPTAKNPLAMHMGAVLIQLVVAGFLAAVISPLFARVSPLTQVGIRLIVVPVAVELLVMVNRCLGYRYLKPHVPQDVMQAYLVGAVMNTAIVGRFLTTSMDSTLLTVLVSLITSAVEVVMRLTMVHRDSFYQRCCRLTRADLQFDPPLEPPHDAPKELPVTTPAAIEAGTLAAGLTDVLERAQVSEGKPPKLQLQQHSRDPAHAFDQHAPQGGTMSTMASEPAASASQLGSSTSASPTRRDPRSATTLLQSHSTPLGHFGTAGTLAAPSKAVAAGSLSSDLHAAAAERKRVAALAAAEAVSTQSYYAFLIADTMGEDIGILASLPLALLFRLPASTGGRPISPSEIVTRVLIQYALEFMTDIGPALGFWLGTVVCGVRFAPVTSKMVAKAVGLPRGHIAASARGEAAVLKHVASITSNDMDSDPAFPTAILHGGALPRGGRLHIDTTAQGSKVFAGDSSSPAMAAAELTPSLVANATPSAAHAQASSVALRPSGVSMLDDSPAHFGSVSPAAGSAWEYTWGCLLQPDTLALQSEFRRSKLHHAKRKALIMADPVWQPVDMRLLMHGAVFGRIPGTSRVKLDGNTSDSTFAGAYHGAAGTVGGALAEAEQESLCEPAANYVGANAASSVASAARRQSSAWSSGSDRTAPLHLVSHNALLGGSSGDAVAYLAETETAHSAVQADAFEPGGAGSPSVNDTGAERPSGAAGPFTQGVQGRGGDDGCGSLQLQDSVTADVVQLTKTVSGSSLGGREGLICHTYGTHAHAAREAPPQLGAGGGLHINVQQDRDTSDASTTYWSDSSSRKRPSRRASVFFTAANPDHSELSDLGRVQYAVAWTVLRLEIVAVRLSRAWETRVPLWSVLFLLSALHSLTITARLLAGAGLRCPYLDDEGAWYWDYCADRTA